MKEAIRSLAYAALILSSHAPAAAAGNTTVLGVTLGAAISKYPRQCGLNEIGMPVKSPCWIDSPYKHKDGSSSGNIKLPDRNLTPHWAEYSLFEISLSKDRVITKVKMRTETSDTAPEIFSAIVKRFGAPPIPATSTASIFGADWSLPDVSINMLCSIGRFCVLGFSIPTDPAIVAKQAEDQRKKDAARSDL